MSTLTVSTERKVYKNFFRNLYFFVTDMESERRDANDIYKIKNVVFVVQLMGTIDLLQHVKNLSLTLQSVNQLPWELEDAVITFVSLMGDLATDLDAGRVNRLLPPTERSNGQKVPAFELLSQHISELKRLKLTIEDGDKNEHTLELQPSSARRVSRATASAAERDPTTEVNDTLKLLAGMARETEAALSQRLTPPDAERICQQA